jgi:hypothetical protein
MQLAGERLTGRRGMTVVSEGVFYCKEGHEPLAVVGDNVCASCGVQMTEIGWFERDAATDSLHPA